MSREEIPQTPIYGFMAVLKTVSIRLGILITVWGEAENILRNSRKAFMDTSIRMPIKDMKRPRGLQDVSAGSILGETLWMSSPRM